MHQGVSEDGIWLEKFQLAPVPTVVFPPMAPKKKNPATISLASRIQKKKKVPIAAVIHFVEEEESDVSTSPGFRGEVLTRDSRANRYNVTENSDATHCHSLSFDK